MSDNIYGDNVYSKGKKMWHNKGRVGDVNERALEVYGKMVHVEFAQVPFTVEYKGLKIESKDMAILRVEEGKKPVAVGHTKGRYNLVQPAQYCTLFDEYVGEPVETLGFLGEKGTRMFITWNLPAIDVHGDAVETYGFMGAGFDGTMGEILHVTGYRVVCQNTWNMAVRDDRQGRGRVYASKHNSRNHIDNLGDWMRFIQRDSEEYVRIHEALFRKMEETKATVDLAAEFFANVYNTTAELTYGPDQYLQDKNAKILDQNRILEGRQDLAMELFKGAGIELNKTVWGMFNAVTELENHYIERGDRTNSILLGGSALTMQKAMALSEKYIR